MDILAHRYGDKNSGEITQSLSSHLLNVAIDSSKIGETIDCKYLMFTIGLLHDLGKASNKFQKFIRNNNNDRVNHSSAGGKYIMNYQNEKFESEDKDLFRLFKEVLAYVIFAHHGYFDIIADYHSTDYNSDTCNFFAKRENYDDNSKEEYEEAKNFILYLNEELKKEKFEDIKEVDKLIEKSFFEFKETFQKIKDLLNKIPEDKKPIIDNAEHFYLSTLIRLYLSILKEADITDTIKNSPLGIVEEYSSEKIKEFWESAYDNIENKYKDFEKINTSIAKSRCMLSNKVREAAAINSNGTFKFYLPTGGGKNLTSLRYAVNNLKNFSKKRILYITSFISVLEQNASEIRKAISNSEENFNELILEHHSNVLKKENFQETEDESIEETKIRFLEDSWISPMIMSTTVQFFNSLFGGKSSNIRRFSKFIDSVIIIDEIQSIPLKYTYLINLMLNFISTIMNANIVLSTATQPKLDYSILDYPIIYGGKNKKEENLINLEEVDKKELEIFDRVEIINMTGDKANLEIDTENLLNFIENEIRVSNSLLIVLNTRAGVRKIYDSIQKNLSKNEEINIFYLTTFLCARHRLDIIAKIKELLKDNKKVICISTNLIEAGVDLDFNVAIRSIAGIDSIIQTAGRCNREGKLNKENRKGKTYVINYSDENIPKPHETFKVAESVIRLSQKKYILENKFIDIEKIKELYYKKYYNDHKSILNFSSTNKIDGSSFLERLGENKTKRDTYEKSLKKNFSNKLAQDFKWVAENLKLISNDNVNIIVRFRNKELIDSLINSIKNLNYKNIKIYLKKLQPYTVSLNKYNFEKLKDKYEVIFDNIFILKEEFYTMDTGINFEKEVVLEDLII